MRPILIALNYRLTGEPFDARVVQLICYLGGMAIVPGAVVALVRHPGSRADFLLGVGLAVLLALLCVMLGMLCRHFEGFRDKVALRSRWPEFASIVGSIGVMITGIRSLAGLGLTPAQVTLGVLLICSLSLARGGVRHNEHRGPVAEGVRTLAEVICRIMEEAFGLVGQADDQGHST